MIESFHFLLGLTRMVTHKLQSMSELDGVKADPGDQLIVYNTNRCNMRIVACGRCYPPCHDRQLAAGRSQARPTARGQCTRHKTIGISVVYPEYFASEGALCNNSLRARRTGHHQKNTIH